MTLTDYEILRVLGEADKSRLRMSELAAQVHVSRSRLTYRVDRLAVVGFVTREECDDDRRGLWAILTDKGGEAFARATPDHHAEIRRLLFMTLDRRSLGVFETALQSMAYRLDGDH
ncbi:MAG: MarR family transcriptional regulator [Acidimicrobiia bacterium]|nr:MarR family transcriptional regulator [Acidimicrobiia bacterium]MDH5519581.1 MarR family transcriptional regulator [Acidimicrobiia bacterium]